MSLALSFLFLYSASSLIHLRRSELSDSAQESSSKHWECLRNLRSVMYSRINADRHWSVLVCGHDDHRHQMPHREIHQDPQYGNTARFHHRTNIRNVCNNYSSTRKRRSLSTESHDRRSTAGRIRSIYCLLQNGPTIHKRRHCSHNSQRPLANGCRYRGGQFAWNKLSSHCCVQRR